jgi:hypothetical protein
MKRAIAIALVVTGAISIAWPFLPKEWGLWEFMGWLFDASDSPSMGIQYMFFWLATFLYGLFAVPLGSGLLSKPRDTLSEQDRELLKRVWAKPEDIDALRRLVERTK